MHDLSLVVLVAGRVDSPDMRAPSVFVQSLTYAFFSSSITSWVTYCVERSEFYQHEQLLLATSGIHDSSMCDV